MKLLINGRTYEIGVIEMSDKGIKFTIENNLIISDIENGFYLIDNTNLYFAQYSVIDIKGNIYNMTFSKFNSITV